MLAENTVPIMTGDRWKSELESQEVFVVNATENAGTKLSMTFSVCDAMCYVNE